MDPKFPCLVNIFGLTLFYKSKWLPLCCNTWKQIQAAHDAEPLIDTTAVGSSSTVAPQTAQPVPAADPVETPLTNSVEKH